MDERFVQNEKNNRALNDLKRHGESLSRTREAILWLIGILWIATIFVVALSYGHAYRESTLKVVATWSIISSTTTIIAVVCMTMVSRKYSAFVTKTDMAMVQDNAEGLDIIRALSVNYNAVYFMDADTGELRFLQLGKRISTYMGEEYATRQPLEVYAKSYAEKLVLPEYREEFLHEVNLENLRMRLKDRKYYAYTYLGDKNGKPNYFQMKVVRLNEDDMKLVIGFADIDSEVREENDRNALLMDALSQAERANKSKDTFLSNISHELLTPLNEIMGRTTMLTLGEDESLNVQDELKKIYRASASMSDMISDILDVSQIDNGEFLIHESCCNLAEIMNTALEKGKTIAENTNVVINFNSNVKNTHIMADATRLENILGRLIEYAVLHSEENGNVDFTASQYGALSDKVRVEFKVCNKGKGFTKSQIDKVFEPFFIDGKGGYDMSFSTITGLAIVRNIVEAMGGRLQIKSSENIGTEITINVGLTICEHEKE